MSLPELKIGKIRSKYPIIQGGMGVGISTYGLSSAVSEAGGIGIIASVALGLNSRHYNGPGSYREANMKALGEILDRALSLSSVGNIGTNCMVAITDYENMVRTSLEKGAKLIISGAGLPLQLPGYARDFPGVALVPLVSSVKAAALIYRRWEKKYGRVPDGFVVETPNDAGGHLGASFGEVGKDDYSLERVVPALKEMLLNDFGNDIPVIAAGGIWDRGDIDKILSLGADGVQMATRFVCTEECDAPIEFKRMYLKAHKDDVVLIKSPVGLPGRAIRNEFVEKIENDTLESDGKCFVNCLVKCSYRDAGEEFCIARALVNARMGHTREGIVFAGSNAKKCDEIITVKQLFRELTGEEQS